MLLPARRRHVNSYWEGGNRSCFGLPRSPSLCHCLCLWGRHRLHYPSPGHLALRLDHRSDPLGLPLSLCDRVCDYHRRDSATVTIRSDWSLDKACPVSRYHRYTAEPPVFENGRRGRNNCAILPLSNPVLLPAYRKAVPSQAKSHLLHFHLENCVRNIILHHGQLAGKHVSQTKPPFQYLDDSTNR